MNIRREWDRLKYKLGVIAHGIKDPWDKFTGILSYDEGLTLARLAKKIPFGGVIVEIGCYKGLSAAYLLEGARKRNGLLYSIDPFDTAIEEQRQDQTNFSLTDRKHSRERVRDDLNKFGGRNFELIQGFSYEVVKEWDRPIDLLWIDGNHEYRAVRHDYEQWEKFIRPGGHIVFHDSNKKDDTKVVAENGWDGPTRVVRELIRPPKWQKLGVVDSITYAVKKQ